MIAHPAVILGQKWANKRRNRQNLDALSHQHTPVLGTRSPTFTPVSARKQGFGRRIGIGSTEHGSSNEKKKTACIFSIGNAQNASKWTTLRCNPVLLPRGARETRWFGPQLGGWHNRLTKSGILGQNSHFLLDDATQPAGSGGQHGANQ